MIKSVFSNGDVDIYKGQREVTAGWAIINKETNKTVKSGHSLDALKAEKTARGWISWMSSDLEEFAIIGREGIRPDNKEYYQKAKNRLVEMGFHPEGKGSRFSYNKAAKKANEARRADQENKHRIEIVMVQH